MLQSNLFMLLLLPDSTWETFFYMVCLIIKSTACLAFKILPPELLPGLTPGNTSHRFWRIYTGYPLTLSLPICINGVYSPEPNCFAHTAALIETTLFKLVFHNDNYVWEKQFVHASCSLYNELSCGINIFIFYCNFAQRAANKWSGLSWTAALLSSTKVDDGNQA